MLPYEPPPDPGRRAHAEAPGPRRFGAWSVLVALVVVGATIWFGLPRAPRDAASHAGDTPAMESPSGEAGPERVKVRGLGSLHTVEPAPGDSGTLLVDIHDVTDVHATVDGWAILDGRGARVVLLDAEGRVTGSLGAAGPGPGELVSPAFVARRGSDVAVLDMTGLQLDVFGPGGAHRFRAQPRAEGCPGGRAGGLDALGDEWIVVLRCMRRAGVTLHVVGVSREGGLRTVETHSDPARHNPFYKPLLVVADALYLGSTLSNCLEGLNGGGPTPLCLRTLPEIPLPTRARDDLERRLGPRARAVGMDLHIPEHLPQLVDIAAVSADRFAVRRPVDEASAPWVLESESMPPEVLGTTGAERLEPGPKGVLMLAEELEGTRGWVVPLPGASR